MDHTPEHAELMAYTMQMDIVKIKNKLSVMYSKGIQDSKVEYLQSMLVRAEERFKKQIEEDRRIDKLNKFPWKN